MRTTVSIDDDLMATVRHYAWSRGLRMSRALDELIRRGLEPRPVPTQKDKSGWVTFEVPPGTPTLTTERLLEIEDEE